LALDKCDSPEMASGAVVPDEKSQGATSIGGKSAGFDWETLWRRVEGDRELLRELIGVFESEFPVILERMESAALQGDAAGLEKAAHKIKGALLQFSAHGAADAARRLEETGRSGKVAGAEEILPVLRQEIDRLLQSLRALAGRGE